MTENSVHFSQFQDTFTQKHHKYSQISRYAFVKLKFCKFPDISNSRNNF